MQEATGIVTAATDPTILDDAVTGYSPGITLVGGQIRIVSNVGEHNAITINPSSMSLAVTGVAGNSAVSLPFTTTYDANGTGTMTDFIAYDSLGSPLQVRLTFELEECNNSGTTYRWYADCPDNQPQTGVEINCGTGRITFDGEGNLFSVTQSTVVINRNDVPANTVEFDLDFNNMTAFDTNEAEASVTSQDGSAPGTLTSFIVGEDGAIRGVYSNGVTRNLGQIRLARFANPDGLEQKGENLYATGINSGEPVQGNPGDQGIGTIVAGAVELSNTDIGGSLVDLILASTMYRGNSRVITTTQEMFDELLNLQR
jgi:flagellar hook protein FlgE